MRYLSPFQKLFDLVPLGTFVARHGVIQKSIRRVEHLQALPVGLELLIGDLKGFRSVIFFRTISTSEDEHRPQSIHVMIGIISMVMEHLQFESSVHLSMDRFVVVHGSDGLLLSDRDTSLERVKATVPVLFVSITSATYVQSHSAVTGGRSIYVTYLLPAFRGIRPRVSLAQFDHFAVKELPFLVVNLHPERNALGESGREGVWKFWVHGSADSIDEERCLADNGLVFFLVVG